MIRFKYVVPFAAEFIVTATVCVTTWCYTGTLQPAPTQFVIANGNNGTVIFYGNSVKTQFVADSKAVQWIKFQKLVRQWQGERGVRSSITEASMKPAYQSIIGMGEEAVPLLIAQLRSEGNDPDHWFWALGAITATNPVKPEDRGDTVKMAQSWIEWSESEGYAG